MVAISNAKAKLTPYGVTLRPEQSKRYRVIKRFPIASRTRFAAAYRYHGPVNEQLV
jgi:hypothetical protein